MIAPGTGGFELHVVLRTTQRIVFAAEGNKFTSEQLPGVALTGGDPARADGRWCASWIEAGEHGHGSIEHRLWGLDLADLVLAVILLQRAYAKGGAS